MGEISYRPLIEAMTWSYSRLEIFDDCPYRWFLTYIHTPKLKKEDKFYATYGLFMHDLLEKYYRGENSKEEILIMFLTQFKERTKGTGRPKSATVQKYFQSGIEFIKSLEPMRFKMISVEEKIDFKIGGLNFTGRIDYLGEEDGDLVIVDNKSRDLKQRSKREKPTLKDKMDLDIQVSKLQLLKQSFLSQKYEMEDKAVRYFPNEIRQCEQRIADYESDIALAKENTPPDRETFPEMQIHDVVYTEKKEAGQAIIEACKAMKSADAVLIGRYRGFPMKLSYDSFQKVFVISMYGKQVYHVPLGTDIHGNITRLDNKIQEIPDKMLRCQDKLENLKVQLENAKEEAQKEFPQEAELAEKVARLGELNVLLDMDKKDQVLLDDGEGVEIEPEQKKKERER